MEDRHANWIDQVAGEYQRGRSLAILYDYDGTLTPIVRHPSLARLSTETRHQLHRLASLPEVGLGVVSGRALPELRSRIGMDSVYYAGSGGLEIDLLGEIHRSDKLETTNAILTTMEDALLGLLQRFPGTWMERKPGSLSIHYRGILPLSAVCFRFEVSHLLAGVPELRSRVVSQAIEIAPAYGWDKGTAVLSILGHIRKRFRSNPLPIYFGDAPNDAEGMTATTQAGGVAIGVEPDAPSVARIRLANIDEVAHITDLLTDRLVASRGLQSQIPESQHESHQPEVTPEESESSSPHRLGILLVDSDAEFRKRVRAGLSQLGWRVHEADTRESASHVMREKSAETQVVLVDLQLPGLQAMRTLAELGQGNPNLVRCFMSADISPYTATAFGRMSDVPLFVKPFQLGELDSTLRTMLSGETATA